MSANTHSARPSHGEGQHLSLDVPFSTGRPSTQADQSTIRSVRTMFSIDTRRLETASQLEVGITDAVRQPIPRKVAVPVPVTQRRLDFEHKRPRLVREMIGEIVGMFMCVYPGMASTTSLLISKHDPVASSVLQIGWTYALSIPVAIITCAPSSGGHFSPAFTICFAYWQGFPWYKVPHYVFSQILGAFLAALCVLMQYRKQIDVFVKEQQALNGGRLVFNGGPANMISAYPPRVETTNLGYNFMTEWMVCSYTGLITWACLDPANPFVTGQSSPFVIGFATAVIIWGFGATAIAMNTARDLGARLVGLMYFGPRVFYYHWYPFISLFVNIPATFFATCIYEILMKDSLIQLERGLAQHEDGEEGLQNHLLRKGLRQTEEGSFVKDEHML